jgi:hypothetical protein
MDIAFVFGSQIFAFLFITSSFVLRHIFKQKEAQSHHHSSTQYGEDQGYLFHTRSKIWVKFLM